MCVLARLSCTPASSEVYERIGWDDGADATAIDADAIGGRVIGVTHAGAVDDDP
jgi:hypothetical protein